MIVIYRKKKKDECCPKVLSQTNICLKYFQNCKINCLTFSPSDNFFKYLQKDTYILSNTTWEERIDDEILGLANMKYYKN